MLRRYLTPQMPYRRIMRHRLHLINEPEQYPYRQDYSLIRLTHWVEADIIAAGNICDTHLPFQIPQDLFCRLRRFLQHLYDLRTGQGSVLREPFDHILFVSQQHDNHLLFVLICTQMRIPCKIRIVNLPPAAAP